MFSTRIVPFFQVSFSSLNTPLLSKPPDRSHKGQTTESKLSFSLFLNTLLLSQSSSGGFIYFLTLLFNLLCLVLVGWSCSYCFEYA